MSPRYLAFVVALAACGDDVPRDFGDLDAASGRADAAVDSVDAAPIPAPDARTGCGSPAAYDPIALEGATPFGDLSSDFDNLWFANGCGSMSARLVFSPSGDLETELLAVFPLPELVFEDAGTQYSEPGDYDVTVRFSACDWPQPCPEPLDVAASLEVRALINDESLETNTDFTLRVKGGEWDIPDIVVTGHSCGWIWNPC